MTTPWVTVTFTTEIEHYTEDCDYVEVQVEASISKFCPATMPGPDGPGCPPEGGEVEELTVTLMDGTPYKCLTTALHDKLCEQAIEEASNA